MKAKDVKVGATYIGKVSGKAVKICVTGTHLNYDGKTRYEVRNLVTGRTTVFRSAAKILYPVT